MVKKIYEQDIIDGMNSVGMTSVAYIDDLFNFYNEKRVLNERLTEDEFMFVLETMERMKILSMSPGNDIQLGHRGFLLDGDYYGAVVLVLDKCDKKLQKR